MVFGGSEGFPFLNRVVTLLPRAPRPRPLAAWAYFLIILLNLLVNTFILTKS
jgi:hypothetical protein